MALRRVYYDASMKKKTILYTEENGNRAVVRKFEIDETNIHRWRKQRDMFSVCLHWSLQSLSLEQKKHWMASNKTSWGKMATAALVPKSAVAMGVMSPFRNKLLTEQLQAHVCI
ncbi:hypothetical protein TNCV_2112611 [Trichonephila clavipes]|nr:hypothetical protein TNCV_2112611 [Trichonephila clavipes]